MEHGAEHLLIELNYIGIKGSLREQLSWIQLQMLHLCTLRQDIPTTG